MIEQGIVQLVQSDPTVVGIAPGGGFFEALPKDQALPSWSYMGVSNSSNYDLGGQHGLVMWRMQIDCYGYTGAEAVRLAKAIDDLLSGFSGTLGDPDHTVVDSCLQSNMIDFELDPDARTYRRMLEYEVWYMQ